MHANSSFAFQSTHLPTKQYTTAPAQKRQTRAHGHTAKPETQRDGCAYAAPKLGSHCNTCTRIKHEPMQQTIINNPDWAGIACGQACQGPTKATAFRALSDHASDVPNIIHAEEADFCAPCETFMHLICASLRPLRASTAHVSQSAASGTNSSAACPGTAAPAVSEAAAACVRHAQASSEKLTRLELPRLVSFNSPLSAPCPCAAAPPAASCSALDANGDGVELAG